MADDALAAPLAAVHHRRELRLLQLVGLAVRLPARRLHALEPGARGAHLAHPRTVASARRSSSSRSPATSACSATSSTTTSSSPRPTTWLSVVGLDLPLALKSIVLPVGISFFTFMAISYVVDAYRGDFEPTTLEKFAVYLSFFPHLVAGPIVRPSELIPQIDTPRDPRRVDTSRAFYLIATGLFKKVVIANYLAVLDRRPGVRRARAALVARDPDRRLRLRGADLRRLLGLHGHRDRHRAPARLHVPAELRLAVRGRLRPGLLAALAHDALALAARLRLHPARRQPRGTRPHLPQPDADDADRRALARGGLDVRRLGRAPRHRAGRRALAARAARRGRRAAARRAGRAGARGSSRSTSSASPGSSSAPTRSAPRGT